MKPSEVRKRRKEIDEEIEAAKVLLDIARAKARSLQRQCSHPKMRKYSAMGEIGNYCPDCEYQD